MLPTIPARDLARARAWYADKLGFTSGQDEAAALLYRSGAERLFLLFASPGAGTAQHQLAAWVVEDVAAEVAALRARGVEFEEYDEPGLRTVDGIAVTPSVRRPGSKTAKATCSPSPSSVTALRRKESRV
jgi:catechol 2,3-dioxygenase-like lactoylglutathione lyase family enzyme